MVKEKLYCPKCKKELKTTDNNNIVVCWNCSIYYTIRIKLDIYKRF